MDDEPQPMDFGYSGGILNKYSGGVIKSHPKTDTFHQAHSFPEGGEYYPLSQLYALLVNCPWKNN